jgi:hypothetical protein
VQALYLQALKQVNESSSRVATTLPKDDDAGNK